MDATKYWSECVKDYASCAFNQKDINDKDAKEIADIILNDDYIWEDIDYNLERIINDYFDRKEIKYLREKEKVCPLDKGEKNRLLELEVKGL